MAPHKMAPHKMAPHRQAKHKTAICLVRQAKIAPCGPGNVHTNQVRILSASVGRMIAGPARDCEDLRVLVSFSNRVVQVKLSPLCQHH